MLYEVITGQVAEVLVLRVLKSVAVLNFMAILQPAQSPE